MLVVIVTWWSNDLKASMLAVVTASKALPKRAAIAPAAKRPKLRYKYAVRKDWVDETKSS